MTNSKSTSVQQGRIKNLLKKIGEFYGKQVTKCKLFFQKAREFGSHEIENLSPIAKAQYEKWIAPLWNNLRPFIEPAFDVILKSVRNLIFLPLLNVLERYTPNLLSKWRSLHQNSRRWIVVVFLALFMAMIVGTLDGHKPKYGQIVNDPDVIDLTADSMELDNPIWALNVQPVAVMPFSETLRVSGKVEFDEQRVARIGATVVGRVTDVLAMPGQLVDQGTVLARINSTELGQTQLAYLKARTSNELATRAYERAKILYKEDVIAKADMQRRQSEAETTAAERRAMADQLRVLGMLPEQIEQLGKDGHINSIAAVTSSVDGTVVERKVVLGQVVQPADGLFTVADLSEVWVTAQVPEQDASLLAVGQPMEIVIPALPRYKFEGNLAYVGELVSNETRTVPARTILKNQERLLKPGMLATLLISGKSKDMVVIPSNSVVREDGYDHVFVSLSDNKYKFTVVKLGPESKGVRPVISGLEPGIQIVTEQAYHLNTERKKRLSGG